MIYAFVYTLGCFCSYSNMDMIMIKEAVMYTQSNQAGRTKKGCICGGRGNPIRKEKTTFREK